MYFCHETQYYRHENKNNTENTVCQWFVLYGTSKLFVAGVDVSRLYGGDICENACVVLPHPDIRRFSLSE